MDSRHRHIDRLAWPGTTVRNLPILRILAMLLAGVAVPAQAADSTDPAERSVVFIDKASQATELFNASKPQEALAVFQELLAHYPDLDEDGYVAMGAADCLAALGRDEEATAAYRSTAASHPDMAATVSQRLIELELSGEPTDATISHLRVAAQARDASRHTAQWRLGRALQTRARGLLTEAAAAFRAAAVDDIPDGPGSLERFSRMLTSHAALLDELAGNLSDLVRRSEEISGSARSPIAKRSHRSDEMASDGAVTEKSRAEWSVRTKDARRVEFQSKCDETGGEPRITANGKPVKLTKTQVLMIRRHEERINAILLDAADTVAEAPPVK